MTTGDLPGDGEATVPGVEAGPAADFGPPGIVTPAGVNPVCRTRLTLSGWICAGIGCGPDCPHSIHENISPLITNSTKASSLKQIPPKR